MATYRVCVEHGTYEVHKQSDVCPECKKLKDKASTKYGGVTVIIPPNMRAVK